MQTSHSEAGGGFLGDVCDKSAQPVRQTGDPSPIPVRTLNHVRLVVPNLQRTLGWYLKLTDMKRQTYQQPEGGAILRVVRARSTSRWSREAGLQHSGRTSDSECRGLLLTRSSSASPSTARTQRRGYGKARLSRFWLTHPTVLTFSSRTSITAEAAGVSATCAGRGE